MPGAVESLLSLAGLGSGADETSSTVIAEGATRTVATSLGGATATVGPPAAAVTTTSVERLTRTTEEAGERETVIGPVENTTGRSVSTSVSSLRPTTTSISSSSTSLRVTTTSITSSSARSTSITVSTSTMTPSSTSTSRSPTASSASSSSATLAIPASATAATDGSDDGFKLSSGIIAAIAVVSVLVALALALVGFRYYKRRSRRNARRVSGLNAWASHRHSENVGGWNGGEDTWRKVEESGEGVGRWEGEKEMVSPFPLRSPVEQARPVPGYDSYSAGYPPQPSYSQPYAYGNEYSNNSNNTQPLHTSYGSERNESPLPVSMLQAAPQAGSGWMPSTPHTFGSTGSNDESFAPDAHGTAVGVPHDDPLAAARAMGLHDGAEVVVKQGFVRSLDDELVITVGETLILVQAYDDGWSLCEKKTVQDGGMLERGVVPLNCLEAFSGASRAEQSVSAPPAAMVGHIGKPEQASPSSGQEFLTMPSPSKAGMMTRSSTAHSLAVSERSERRSSLFLNAAAAGLWLQSQPPRP